MSNYIDKFFDLADSVADSANASEQGDIRLVYLPPTEENRHESPAWHVARKRDGESKSPCGRVIDFSGRVVDSNEFPLDITPGLGLALVCCECLVAVVGTLQAQFEITGRDY